MPKLAVQPFVLKDVVLTIEVDDYARHVSSVQFVPTTNTPQLTWQGLSPDAKFSEAGTPDTSWLANLSYAQDWETEDSLSEYLLEHAGETKTVMFQPKAGSGQRNFTADVTIVPGPIGGDVNTVQVGQVSLPVDGEPIPGESV